MPNYCNNEVRVFGEAEEVQKFVEHVRGKWYHGRKCGEEFITVRKDDGWVDEPNPNYCGAKEFKDTCEKFQEPFSFQSILPMPDELMGTNSPPTIMTEEEIADSKATTPYSFTPMTQETSDRFIEQYGSNNWYDWCNYNWGTKWDCTINDSDCNLGSIYGQEDTEAWYDFDTAWCPPEPIYHQLVALFPNLEISWFYREDGCQLAGFLGNE